MENAAISHVVVGYSAAMLADLDRLLPAGSVLVLEEPEIAQRRDAERQLERFPCVARLETVPTQDEHNATKLAALVERPPAVRAVLPGLEYGVVAVAALAQAWGLPGCGPTAAAALRDKSELRRLAGQAGIRQPDWQVVADHEGIARFRSAHGGQCVIKPTKLQASVGVQLLGPHDDLAEAWAATVAADERHLRVSGSGIGACLAEERLHGAEVSVEALVANGKIFFWNVTAKHLYPGRYPVELGHVVPAGVEEAVESELRAMMEALIRATAFDTGIMHSEWILADGRPHLVECAGRIPGDRIPRLIDLAYRTDLVAGLVSLMEGDVTTIDARPQAAAAIRFLAPPRGRIVGVSGLDEAAAVDGVVDVVVSVQPGATVAELTSSWARAGHVLATGPDGAAAWRNVCAAAEAVRFEVEAETAS